MKTHRLDQQNSYTKQLNARLLGMTQHKQNPAIILDQTIFYPEGGGQYADQGTLWPKGSPEDTVQIVDVIKKDGKVLHILDKELPTGIKEIEGQIDWVRRFDHMQQHTGQHILSASLFKLYRIDTVSSRLGAESGTIDILGDISRQVLEEVEELSNQILCENRAVSVRYPTEKELSQMELRRAPQVQRGIRVVEVEDFDISPCGGTHVTHTGEIGSVFILSKERYKKGTRIRFLCGKRVYRSLRSHREESESISSLLSAPLGEQSISVKRLLDDSRQKGEKLEELLLLLAKEKASVLCTQSEIPLIRKNLSEEKSFLRLLAKQIAQQPKFAAFLGTEYENRGHLIFAASADSGIDAGARLKAICAKLGGRGGGRASFAEGICPLEHLEEALKSA